MTHPPACGQRWLGNARFFHHEIIYKNGHTVDGRNPAPVDRWFIPLFTGFQPSKVMQDFSHPQYSGVLM
jgi:hypothetical protein